MEISGNVARDDHKARITPRHIAIAVRDDPGVANGAGCRCLSSVPAGKFKVSGIPSFVIVDAVGNPAKFYKK